ncbi:PASTA domain-containing protein [Streptomyces sp. JNUCC 63]
MNPYSTNRPPSQPWWRATPALLGLLALVALLSAVSLGLGFLVVIATMVAVWVLPSWRWYAKLGTTFGAFFLLLISAGMSGQLNDSGADKSEAEAKNADDPGTETTPSPSLAKTPELTDYTGKSLDEAEKEARAAGFTPGRHDASAEGRSVVVRSVWTVCFQKVDTTAKSVAFAAVRTGEPCPTKDGDPIPWPTMPDVVGDTYNAAVKELDRAGIDLNSVTLDDVYLDIDAPSAEEAAEKGDEWRVCFQRPEEDSEVTSATTVHLDLAREPTSISSRSARRRRTRPTRSPPMTRTTTTVATATTTATLETGVRPGTTPRRRPTAAATSAPCTPVPSAPDPGLPA